MGARSDEEIQRRCAQRIGTVIEGKYELEALLGYGSAGAVYRAHNRWAGRRCAVKIFHYEGPDERSLLRRFVREAQAANRVTREGRPHPNVVQALDVGRDRDTGRFFIVQELLEGETLAQHLARQPERRVEVAAALDVMLPALDAIAAAHAAGVVHRDLKPENIFLAREGSEVVPKLVDFGIAMLHDDRMTPNAEVLGTPQYMSPESFRGIGQVDGRADVWAAAVILYEMLAGVSPFASPTGSAVEALRRILAVTPPNLAGLGRCGHPTWCALRRAMRKDPAARTPTAEGFRDALLDAQAPVRILRVLPGATRDALREALLRGDDLRAARGDDDGPDLALVDDPARCWWSLVFHGNRDVDELRAALALPELARRVELHVAGVPLGDEGLARLLDDGALDDLTVLSLRRAGLGAAGAGLIAESPQCANLLRLDLEENAIGAAGVRALATSAQLESLRALSLVLADLDAGAAEALADSAMLGRLARLDLSQNRIGDEGLAALAASARLSPALWLAVARNRLSRAAVAQAQRELSARVRKLVV